MPLTLTIENETALPDGGPLTVSLSGGRGLDIGRDQHLDWCLPDPTRAISGRHCEVRFRDGAYWLRDISTNGTYVNGGSQRVQSPYRLQHGDRLEIGHYVIAVAIDEPVQAEPSLPRVDAAPDAGSLWSEAAEAAPPIPRRDLLPPSRHRPVHDGFIDWAADIPAPAPAPPPPAAAPPPPASDDFAWAPYQAPPSAPEPPPVAIPTPRRPLTADLPPGDPWSDAPAQPATPVAPLPPLEPPAAPGQPFVPPAAAAMPAGMPQISAAEFVQRFAKGAGLSTNDLAWQDPGAFAEQLGGLMRLVAVQVSYELARARTRPLAS